MLLQPSHRLVNSFSPLLFISCMFHCSQFTTCCSLYPTHDLHFTEQSFYFYLFLYPSTPVYKTIRFFFNVEETSNRGTGVNKRKLYIQINHILSTVLISGCIDWHVRLLTGRKCNGWGLYKDHCTQWTGKHKETSGKLKSRIGKFISRIGKLNSRIKVTQQQDQGNSTTRSR